MILDGLFGSSYGCTGDARALSMAEISKIQADNAIATSQARIQQCWQLLTNASNRPPAAPLDERFADFKVRLAAAIERRRK